jgi:(E)-4-hydroxy-3-methylbut-2-enyl-diphosphate synthase
VTATGLPLDGIVKSSVGIGVLLFGGIGDTIRVSLLDEPSQEVKVARLLLNSLGLRNFGPELICCPTCGRCEVDLAKKARKLDGLISRLDKKKRQKLNHYKIALMGCLVNGPGEAREADLGIAFSKRKGVLFKKGRIVRTVDLNHGEETLFSVLQTSYE